ncbi:MAG: hypothetical protein ACUZ8H_01470 [Candidatus Anammoxibacter sp.]
MNNKVKCGIVVDNYKLRTYKRRLKKEGYTDYKTSPWEFQTTTIAVKVDPKDVGHIHKICKELEAMFLRNRN